MQKKFEKGSEQWLLFMDYYNLIQKYYIPEDSDDWWSECTTAFDELWSKYNKSDYVKDLIVAHISDLGRRFHDIQQRK